jgi:SAM-dependent methyltransferase
MRPAWPASYAAAVTGGVMDGDVTGKRLVHLQCHVGLDTLSWARRGALVTGLDFSEPAIEAARSLAAGLAIDASFTVADVYDAVTALGGRRFDVVYTGTGALVWLPDMTRWARVVAALLAPGGFLYLVEGHPFGQILDDAQGAAVVSDYFDDQPQVEDYPYTYTDGPALRRVRSVQFRHPLGQVVTALAAAGLRIDFLNEHDFDAFQRYQSLERHGGEFRFPAGRPRVLMMYSLRATRPGSARTAASCASPSRAADPSPFVPPTVASSSLRRRRYDAVAARWGAAERYGIRGRTGGQVPPRPPAGARRNGRGMALPRPVAQP